MKKPLLFFLILIVISTVFILNVTYAGVIPQLLLGFIRVMLVVLFAALWILFKRKNKPAYKGLAFILMTVNLAFLIVSFFTADFWNLKLDNPRGIAFAKLSDGFVISLVLIILSLAGRYRLKDIYLARGRIIIGLIIGPLTFILMGYLAINDPGQSIDSNFLKSNLKWILTFVFANAFMEELLFRGVFLKQLSNLFKPIWTITLTSIVFAVSHMQVTYTPDVLVFVGIVLILGFIWGLLMHYTKSIIASMLFHAGADLMIIIPIYSSFGIGV